MMKAGIIEDPAQLSARAFLRSLVGLPKISVDVIAAALLDRLSTDLKRTRF